MVAAGAVLKKKVVLPLFAVLDPQLLIVLAVAIELPPISLPGLNCNGAPKNSIGLFTLLIALL